MEVSQNIRLRRLQLGMSQKELADAAGYRSRSAIAKIESGDNDLPLSKLGAIAEALDTTVEHLIIGQDAGVRAAGTGRKHIADVHRGFRCCVLVLAGGRSTRNQQNIPNQFINVLGKPVIMYSLEAYQRHPLVDDIYVVCLRGWERTVAGYARRYGISKLRGIVQAGDSGLESIRAGFGQASQDGFDGRDIAIIQETTRPFVTEETISKLLNACLEHGSSVMSEPLSDHLVFRQGDDGTMTYLDRNSLLSMQSPDAHRFSTLRDMFEEADRRNLPLRENCCGMLLNELGLPLHFCRGSHNNIKLVRQEDIAIFTALLRRQDE